jgi:glyoxylase-like metal-dependent hydrolase (beta-lactamase superfamily II)
MAVRIDHAVTSGTFSLDGGSWDVVNNVWVVGDDDECVVIDAPHEIQPIIDVIGNRRLSAVLCTHAHDDHVTVAQELSERYGAPVRLHVGDEVLWRQSYPDFLFQPVVAGERIPVADIEFEVLHTPGHSPGAVCYYSAQLATVFSGDTLFQGGPGATGRSFSNFETIIDSIRSSLLTLPAETTVHTGHGDDTSIAAEAPHLSEWVNRGH